MDRALPIVTSAGDMSWADNQSLSSDEGRREAWSAPQPQMDGAWNGSTGAAHIQGGQISPASGMETIMENSTAPTMANSTTSSTGSWGSGNAEPEIDEADHDNDVRWEQDSDDILKVPKLEPTDEEEFNFDHVKAAPLESPGIPSESATNPQAPAQAKPKRPRGRPRKHPINPVVSASKVTKGRSKTGCITCRKRKKKCDEAKPRCESTMYPTLWTN